MNKKALGRYEELGSLFNARTDDFIGAKLFRKSIDKKSSYYSSIESTPSKYEYINKESYENKFSKLNIDGELKVSILLNMVSLGGSGKFLKNNKDTQKSNKFSIISNNQTRIEKINLYDDEIKEIISSDALNNINATHVVVGIVYGANIIVSMEYNDTDNQDDKDINGSFNAYCDKIKGVLSLEGKVGASFNDGEKISDKNLTINIDSDIEITQPTSIKEALNLIKSFKDNIAKTNNGVGIPLEYILQPLNQQVFPTLQVNRNIQYLNENTIKFIQDTFEKILQKKQAVKDNLNDLEKYSNYIPINLIEKFQDKETFIYRLEINFKESLKKILIEVRSCNENVNKIETFMQENNNILKEIDQLGNDLLNLKKKFRFDEINRFQESNIIYLSRNDDLDLELKHLKNDVYIFYSFSEFKFSEMRKKNYICFFNLRETKPDAYFYVINNDIHNLVSNISSPRIYYYAKGELITDDYLVYQGSSSQFQILAKLDKQLEKKNFQRIVLLGKKDTGKRTIFDKVFNNYLYKILGNRLFKFIDTDGPVEDKQLLLINVNTIFIVLKYENNRRLEHMLENYLDEIKNIENFKNKIIVITHSDFAENPTKDFKNICELLKDYCQNIIFYSKYSDSAQMANIMYSFMSIIEK